MAHRGIVFAFVIAAAGCGGGQKKKADTTAARQAALKDAASYGAIGALNSTFGSDTYGGADVWGSDTGLDDSGGLMGTSYGGEGYGYGYGSGLGLGQGGGGIGLGTYGTLGHGSGSSDGNPTYAATPTIDGAVDPLEALTVLADHDGEYAACAPGAVGTMVVTFTIDAKGAVHSAKATEISAEADACVVRILKQLTFPAPSDGKPAKVSMNVVFQ
jgi:Gram-negative bacterial TonB protein C-terminal